MLTLTSIGGKEVSFETDEDVRLFVEGIPDLDGYTLWDVFPAYGTWATVGLAHLAKGEAIRTYKDWWND